MTDKVATMPVPGCLHCALMTMVEAWRMAHAKPDEQDQGYEVAKAAEALGELLAQYTRGESDSQLALRCTDVNQLVLSNAFAYRYKDACKHAVDLRDACEAVFYQSDESVEQAVREMLDGHEPKDDTDAFLDQQEEVSRSKRHVN